MGLRGTPLLTFAVCATLAFCAACTAYATDAHAAYATDAREGREPGSELTISLLTMGPGDHPFYKFGHDALLVHDAHDPRRPRDDVYNYGTFDYRSPALISDFLEGRLQYWLSTQSLWTALLQYRSENRTVTAQELALAPADRRALADRLARDALPENRYYRYDYLRNNCTTRVRDVLDEAVGGRLRAASTAPATLTFRGHTQRLTADDVPVYLGLDVTMGDVVDQPITQWEEMFLPSMLEERVRHVTLTTPAGEVPLVARETPLLDAKRAPSRETPPRWALSMGLLGAAFGGVLVVLGATSRRSRVARVAFGLTLATVGLVAGLLGCVFVFFWVATDHYVAHHNENLLVCSPLALALAVFAVAMARGSGPATRAVATIAPWLAASSMLGLTLKVLPAFDQHNGAFVALLAPLWIGAAVGARLATSLDPTSFFIRPWLRRPAPRPAGE